MSNMHRTESSDTRGKEGGRANTEVERASVSVMSVSMYMSVCMFISICQPSVSMGVAHLQSDKAQLTMYIHIRIYIYIDTDL